MRDLSVVENVMIGVLSWTASVEEAREHAAGILARVGLGSKTEVAAEHLTLPDRKLLELCRALATRPRLLLLDEVMAGLRPSEADRIVEVLRDLRDNSMTILLVEHVMRIVMSVAERVIVLHHGRLIADGPPEDVVRDRAVIESYLGRAANIADANDAAARH
jgi:branched-chain amino acid transport system ATP-binding protein